jgi:hypothetical protein
MESKKVAREACIDGEKNIPKSAQLNEQFSQLILAEI